MSNKIFLIIIMFFVIDVVIIYKKHTVNMVVDPVFVNKP